MESSYTKRQVSQIADIPYRNVQFYTERGLVQADVELGEGKGNHRRYSNRALVSFIIAGELAEYGMTISEIGKVTTVVEEFWKIGIDELKKSDEDFLDYLSSMGVAIKIGKGKNKARIISLQVGVDENGDACREFSKINLHNGKLYVCFQDHHADRPITRFFESDDKPPKSKDLMKLKTELVSYIYIRLDELVRAALGRMP